MRLLAFLTSIESTLRSAGLLETSSACSRSVDYLRGLARLRLDDAHSVALAHYRLASGRSCLRVHFEREGNAHSIETFYPEADGFSWEQSAKAVVDSLTPFLRLESVDSVEPEAVNA